MADPATNTSYPGSLDLLPEIGPNDKQNDPDLEHDVVHDKANAVLNALQALVGFTGDTAESGSVLGRLLALESGGLLDVISEPSAFTADPAAHAGRRRYIRAGGDVTFDSAKSYVMGQVFNIRATAAMELFGTGVTLSPTAGGTLELDAGMAVTVVMTSATTADVIGLTVAA
ncbi:hypothetical protein H9645_03600 [Luteimonas sp. Sa2BVA3]|uniref:Baseplate protein J-like domain-containing protein n=1 Tax=Luteimonas colneyensis TaxID=2762230 RepID=A0ABR8UGF6_9GAMM|nr:hypothetical protein [Luteimonas colneyensis]MBD7987106.1 hypothetical protein [Luteimonas colneyensis]